MTNILSKLITTILAAILGIGVATTPPEEPTEPEPTAFGSYYAVGGKYYKLWGSGIDSDDTSLILTSFKSPINDQEFTMTNFGDIGYGTIEPNNVDNVEFISFTGITQAAGSDKATLTGVQRGLNFVYPYNASTSLANAHAGGSRFIITNPPMHYYEYPAKLNAESIWGDWTFSSTNTPQYNTQPSFTDNEEIVTKKYCDDLTNAGAATMSTTTPGLGILASSDILIDYSTTSYGSTRTPYLVRAHRFATSSDKLGATTTVPLTDSDGLLDQSFYDLTESYTLSNASNTIEGLNVSTKVTTTDDIYVGDDATIIGNLTVNSSSSIDTLTVDTISITSDGSTFASSTFNGTSTYAGYPLGPGGTPTDGEQFVDKNYVDTNMVQCVHGGSSRAANTGAGTQNIWLTAGFKPAVARITAYRYDGQTSPSADDLFVSHGGWDDTHGQYASRIGSFGDNALAESANSATDIVYLCGKTSNACDTVINAIFSATSSDGFSLAWDANPNDSGDIYFFWEVCR